MVKNLKLPYLARILKNCLYSLDILPNNAKILKNYPIPNKAKVLIHVSVL